MYKSLDIVTEKKGRERHQTVVVGVGNKSKIKIMQDEMTNEDRLFLHSIKEEERSDVAGSPRFQSLIQ